MPESVFACSGNRPGGGAADRWNYRGDFLIGSLRAVSELPIIFGGAKWLGHMKLVIL